eukprot:TRINITY_DN2497_c0_g1_i5.p1 TRINITY_DN2497_c0_g1~~TRINITY_DN2497_c0_g1_i5.p1  ORF type:complete len:752 (-),score=144.02 TRINITY_DN2497_c0_g1_i5:13-2268(-)
MDDEDDEDAHLTGGRTAPAGQEDQLVLSDVCPPERVLQVCVCSGGLECAKLLLSRKVASLSRCRVGTSPLISACLNFYVDAAALCIGLAQQPKHAAQALLAAAGRGNTECIQLLLSHGVSLDVHSRDGSFALHHTAFNGCWEAAYLLIDNGADVDIRDAQGNTPLQLAICAGHTEFVEKLLLRGAHLKTSLTWNKPHPVGQGPDPGVGISATVLGNKLFLIGEFVKSDSTEVFSYDIERMHWHKEASCTEPPPGIVFHTAVTIGPTIYCVGGISEHRTRHNDAVYAFNTETMAWRPLVTLGDPLTPRFAPVAAVVGKFLLVGAGAQDTFDIIDTEAMTCRNRPTNLHGPVHCSGVLLPGDLEAGNPDAAGVSTLLCVDLGHADITTLRIYTMMLSSDVATGNGSLEWQVHVVTTSDDATRGLCRAKPTLFTCGGSVFILGQNRGVFELQLGSWSVRRIDDVAGSGPVALAGVAATSVGHECFFYGGSDNSYIYSSFYILTTSKRKTKPVCQAFRALLDGFLADVSLVTCGGARIPAHRVILAARSSVFRRLLAAPAPVATAATNELVLPCDVGLQALRSVLEFAYTDTVTSLSTDHAADAVRALDSLFPELKLQAVQCFTGIMLNLIPSTFSADLGRALKMDRFSDCTFTVADTEFHLHMTILCSRCPYFRALFYGGLRENCDGHSVEVGGASPEAFAAFVQFVYTGTLPPPPLSPALHDELLGIADFYNVEDLLDMLGVGTQIAMNKCQT